MSLHHKINYIQIPVKALASSTAFFKQVFGWSFVDYGDDYAGLLLLALKVDYFRLTCKFPLKMAVY